MRLLVVLMTLLLLVGYLGFLLTNLDTTVTVIVWQTEHADIPLALIVLVAVVTGIVWASVIALAEGAQIRLTNRRLSKEMRKLDNELNYLRTQPATTRPAESPPAAPAAEKTSGEHAERRPPAGPSSAPVYSDEDAEWDDDGDPYSGGRAV